MVHQHAEATLLMNSLKRKNWPPSWQLLAAAAVLPQFPAGGHSGVKPCLVPLTENVRVCEINYSLPDAPAIANLFALLFRAGLMTGSLLQTATTGSGSKNMLQQQASHHAPRMPQHTGQSLQDLLALVRITA
jgi:hypothetical protein